jgi:hypothetical protein
MPDKIISKLITTIDTSITGFNESIPAIQKQIFDDISLLVKDLDTTSDGTIKNNVRNLKIIGKIRSKLEEIILSPEYMKKVEDFAKAFNEVASLQNQYFRAIESKFNPSKLLEEISKQAISWTIDGLTESGIGANVTDEIEQILRTNITAGGSYKDLTNQLRNSIVNKEGKGLLERYVKQVTVDSIQQYNRTYSQTIASDLGMTWRMYVGSNINTTREWCEWMTKKKYIHISEFDEVLKGHILGHQVKMNPKTELWYGAIDGTNKSNLEINAGGHACGHQFQPVLSAVVPKDIRMKFEK